MLGNGSNRYQFVHADDLASLCAAAGMAEGPAIFNCGTDRFGTMREALEHGDWNSASDSRLLLPGSISIAREIIESWAAL